jgi:CRISPR/Cas system CSM-associated protein Csm3 (group 7 of RAMP superfamily)
MTHPQSFKQRRITAVYEVTYSPVSPLLIREAEEEKDEQDNKSRPLKEKQSGRYIIPGSSLKGVFRSYSENVFAHLFGETEQDNDNKQRKTYDELSSAQKLFGAGRYKGRLAIFDSYMEDAKIEEVTKTAIDRFRGGPVDGALYELHAVNEGTFTVRIVLTNPEKWQLYWTTFLLRQLGNGKITLGSKSAIGYGRLAQKNFQMTLTAYSKKALEEWEHVIQEGSRKNEPIFTSSVYEDIDHLGKTLEPEWQNFLPEKEAAR